jgi:hypothetical protein
MRCKAGKVFWLPSALVARRPPESGDDPDNIHGRGIHELLKGHPRAAVVSGTAMAAASRSMSQPGW